MSEPTPPPPSLDKGATPPPPPPPPVDPSADAATEPTAPVPPASSRRNSRLGLMVLVGVVVLALVATGAVAAVMVFTGSDSHKIVTPATAAGMKRDGAQEKQLRTQLDSAEQQFKQQGEHIGYVRSAVYHQADADRGPEGALVFLGAKLTKERKPATFVNRFRKQASANGFKVTDVSPGDGGGEAVCAAQVAGTQKVAICAWATKDTMGELVPTVPGYDAKQLAAIMKDLREDVEQSA